MRKAQSKNPYPQNLLMDILKFYGNYAINYKGLKYALGCLNALQFEIIYRYYKEMRTYKEIGEELNFTPEYICKIKFAAIEKLRNYKLKRYIICKKRIPKEDTISYTYDRDIIEFNTLSDRTYKILMRNALDTPRKML